MELFFCECLGPPLPSGHGQLCLQISNLLLQAGNHLCRDKWESTCPPLANATLVAGKHSFGSYEALGYKMAQWLGDKPDTRVQSLGPRPTQWQEESDSCRLSSELYICIKCAQMGGYLIKIVNYFRIQNWIKNNLKGISVPNINIWTTQL